MNSRLLYSDLDMMKFANFVTENYTKSGDEWLLKSDGNKPFADAQWVTMEDILEKFNQQLLFA